VTEPRILVLTTVHASDDTRIRERLIRSLEMLGTVSYATRAPGPSDRSGLDWIELGGGRLARNLSASRHIWAGDFDLVVLHDPETIPAGVLGRLLRRRLVVYDVHEDLAGQIVAKSVPKWSRPLLRALARTLNWLAERTLILTFAEPGYRRLFRHDHIVFPNYPRTDAFPRPAPRSEGFVIYVGDITEARGIEDAVNACVLVEIPFTAVGRVDPVLASRLARTSPEIQLTGRLSNPRALELIGSAAVGLSPLRDLPNYRGSLPTKVLEYLAMGIPVVATNLPGTASVLAGLDGVWLVPPGDVELMARAIEEAMRPASKELAMGQVPEVRRRFRWPEDEVQAFYRDLLTGSGTPDPN
jgi:glycosyltransferase involved in cell wall biosynthesis